jgi:hypothetical protein
MPYRQHRYPTRVVNGSKEEVFEAVREAIADAGKGGGYILAAAHSHEAVTVDRLRWMLEADKEYGLYPLEPESRWAACFRLSEPGSDAGGSNPSPSTSEWSIRSLYPCFT